MKKTFKNIKSKKEVNEAWTPVLSGDYSTTDGGCTNPFSDPEPIDYDYCSDMIDKPQWLDPDAENYKGPDHLSLGAFYINGVPLSTWSTRLGGSAVSAYKNSTMQGWYATQKIFKKYFPDGLNTNQYTDDIFDDLKITNLNIIKMLPMNGGINFNIFIKFKLEDIDEFIFGKFENIGTQKIPDFQCSQINKFSQENKIKVKGKIWNIIKDWLQVKPGIYTVLVDEVLVYTETGQLINLHIDNKVEITYSNDEIIKLQFNNITYIIKKPTYYWFNWQFQKV